MTGAGAAAGVAALLFLAAGCLPTLARATFPAASDTTEPGTLLGPFDGRVTDAQNGRPLPSALVWVAWRFCRGTALCIPAGTEVASTDTDADGHYQIPRLGHFPGAVRLDGVTVAIYRRGYVAYRSDQIYDARGGVPRRDFAQSRNDVRLERFPEGGNHAVHLAFLGGSGALRAAARAEALQRSLDVDGPAAGAAPLDAFALFSAEELRQLTGSVDEFTLERLEDRPRTPRYDSAHFRAQARGEDADGAFRVQLADTEADADRLFDLLLAELPGAAPVEPAPTGLGTRAARGKAREAGADLLGLLVVDRAERAVVLFTCGVALCRDADALDAIARKVIARLPRIAHPPPEPPAPAPAHEDDSMKLREPELHR